MTPEEQTKYLLEDERLRVAMLAWVRSEKGSFQFSHPIPLDCPDLNLDTWPCYLLVHLNRARFSFGVGTNPLLAVKLPDGSALLETGVHVTAEEMNVAKSA